jgi:mannose-6-phosphate isomerase-like protein (cupin superfamily)
MTLYNVAAALNVPITFFFPGSNGTQMGKQSAYLIKSQKTPSELRTSDQREFDDPAHESKSPVMRPDLRMAIELMGGVRWERLTPKDEQDIQFLEIQYQPGASSGPAMSRHSGREFGLMLSGELKLELGFDHYTLTAGDSIVFDSTTPHRLSNAGTETFHAIWVIMNRSG